MYNRGKHLPTRVQQKISLWVIGSFIPWIILQTFIEHLLQADAILDISRKMLRKSDMIPSFVEFMITWGRETQQRIQQRQQSTTRLITVVVSAVKKIMQEGRKSQWRDT